MEGEAESVKFITPALGGEFDAAIGQIAHRAGDLKAGGDGFGGMPETDALNTAGIKNCHAAAGGMAGGVRHG